MQIHKTTYEHHILHFYIFNERVIIIIGLFALLVFSRFSFFFGAHALAKSERILNDIPTRWHNKIYTCI